MTMQATPEVELGETLVRVAKGEVSLATLAGLGPEELGEILHFALTQLEVGRTREAMRVLEGLVALDPANPVFHEYLGLAAERSQDLDRALGEYTENLTQLARLEQVDDRLLEGYLLRARLLAMRGAVREAASDLATAKRYDHGGDAALTQELARLERAVAGATGGAR